MVAVAMLAFATATSAASVDRGKPLRIMPLGDSITQGGGREHAATYRYPLWKMLVDEGVAFDLVGTQDGGPEKPLPDTPDYQGKAFDPDHEGHWGYYTDQLLRDSTLETWLAANTPDVVLLHLGTNDAFRGASAEETRIKLTRIVRMIQQANPEVKILLARLINSTSDKNPRILSYNQQMDRIARETTSERSPVAVVDLNTGFDPETMTVDGTHPNREGAQWMADRWMESFRSLLRHLPGSDSEPHGHP